MAQYSLVRGWLECSFEDVSKIKEIVFIHWETAGNYQVNTETASLYRQGWIFPSMPMNWVSLIFYGGNINTMAVPFLKACLSKIAKSGLDVSGVFYVDDEEGLDLQLWSLSGHGLIEVRREGGA